MQQQTEISLSDILGFLRSNWKLYLVSLLLFVCVALGLNVAYPIYTAALTLKYSGQTKPEGVSSLNDGIYDSHFDLVAWRTMQEKLVLIAKEQIERSKDSPVSLSEIASQSWWSQHVSPVKALTSDEAKELLGINAMIVGTNKPTEESNAVQYLGRAIKESTRIAGLTIAFSDQNPQTAIEKVEFAANFIQNLAGIMRFKRYVEGLEQSLLDSTNKIVLESTQLNKELLESKRRHQELNRLYKEYPEAPRVLIEGAVNQENSKYLPLANQLIANSLHIYELETRISQLSHLDKRNWLYKTFLSEAQKVILSATSSAGIYEGMLGIEMALRTKIKESDFAAIQALDTIHYQLHTIRQIAETQFAQNKVSIIKKPDYYKAASKAAFLGLVVGVLISLMILFIRITYSRQPK